MEEQSFKATQGKVLELKTQIRLISALNNLCYLLQYTIKDFFHWFTLRN